MYVRLLGGDSRENQVILFTWLNVDHKIISKTHSVYKIYKSSFAFIISGWNMKGLLVKVAEKTFSNKHKVLFTEDKNVKSGFNWIWIKEFITKCRER